MGIASVDFPDASGQDSERNAYFGALAALAIAENLFEPAIDPINKTPFGTYGATLNSGRELESAGFKKYTAVSHLRFHTDGLLTASRVSIPDYVMVYNIAISYREPGFFNWLPFSVWNGFRKYVKIIGKEEKFDFELTQSAYKGRDGELYAVGRKRLRAPIFVGNDVRPAMFLNGSITSSASGSSEVRKAVDDMLDSMVDDPGVIRIEQKERRAVFIANTIGCHSRDTFQHAKGEGDEYTRLFIRCVSSGGVFVCDDPVGASETDSLDSDLLE